MVLSPDPDTTSPEDSGPERTANANTGPVWPSITTRHFPSLGLHIRSVLSKEAEIRFPEGNALTDVTYAGEHGSVDMQDNV